MVGPVIKQGRWSWVRTQVFGHEYRKWRFFEPNIRPLFYVQGVPYVFAAFLVVNIVKSGENMWRTL